MADDLLTYLKTKSYGEATLAHVKGVFDTLALPLPQTGEFYKTEDMGALVFLSSYACCLRLTTVSQSTFIHPDILQPLISYKGDELHADLYPGVTTPYTSRDYSQWFDIYTGLEERLEAKGLQATDINANNGGQLPAPYGSHCVLIDPGAVRRLTSGVKYVESLLPDNDPQNILFGELKASFDTAVKARNPALINQAWKACEQAKAQGILVANWENVDYGGTQRAAARYNLRLS